MLWTPNANRELFDENIGGISTCCKQRLLPAGHCGAST